MSRPQLQPKRTVDLRLGLGSPSRPRPYLDPPPPVASITLVDGPMGCDSSCSSREEMHGPLHRNAAPRRAAQDQDEGGGDEDWTRLLGAPASESGSEGSLKGEGDELELLRRTFAASASPREEADPQLSNNHPSTSPSAVPDQPKLKPILRRRLSTCSSLTSYNRSEHLRRQQRELQSIQRTLQDLQHNFVSNDNSVDASNPQGGSQGGARRKEFAVRNFPNGDLFSGNVDADTGELIYGRMNYILEMEVYEGGFQRGQRHGEGAVCTKMDGGAKFLGRYHEGQMHSGTLVVTRGQATDFTYTGTFLHNDFHGVGTIASHDGSIYQGQFRHGQYHGVGTLRTIGEEEDDERGADAEVDGGKGKGAKMESVYTGDFSDGLFHGSGSLTHSDGSSYVGTWREGKRVDGTETLPNGDVYEGKFVDDMREGEGILTIKGGKVSKRGVWEKDVLKEGFDVDITFADGHEYSGHHVNSLPHGFGVMDYADTAGAGKSTYTGDFLNGVRHGEGRCFFHKTGEEYEGEWAFDEPVDLRLFQHDGPLLAGSENGLEEGGDVADAIGRLPIRPNQLNCAGQSMDAASSRSTAERKHRQSLNSDLTSSIVSRASAGDYSIDTLASVAVSNAKAASDDLFQSLFDCTEGLKLYQYANGDLFKGRLDRTNLRQGSGVYTEHRMGSRYNGDWKDSKRHGVGHLLLGSGVEYSGEFFEDKCHGQGSLTLIDGSVYTGSFFNGLFHGRGVLEDKERGQTFVGNFERGERCGDGDEKFADGSRYKGEYKTGSRNGSGTLFDPDGTELYRGEWRDGLRHGSGKLFRHQRSEGSSWEGDYEGNFFRGGKCGSGKFTYTDGTCIDGQWLDDAPRDGDWTIVYLDGSKYYGFATFQHMEETVASDRSTSRGPDASKTGEALRVPLPHGYGSLTYPSGRRVEGAFRFGEHTHK